MPNGNNRLVGDMHALYGPDVYVLPGRVNQDILESFFSLVRGKGGANFNPTPVEAKCRVRNLVLMYALRLGINPVDGTTHDVLSPDAISETDFFSDVEQQAEQSSADVAEMSELLRTSNGARPPRPEAAQSRRRLTERTGATVCTVTEAVRACDVAVICVPFDFYSQLPVSALSGKVVVDISNSTPQKLAAGVPSNAEDLQNMIPKAEVVKGFNVISAYALENNLQGGKKVFIAGDFTDAKATVATLISDMGFTPSDMGGLIASRKIEKIPLQLFPSWKTAVIVTALIFIFFWVYSLFKYQICTTIESERPWEAEDFTSVLMVNFNKALAMSGITILAAAYLPDVFAAYLQLKRGTKYRQFPRWLNKWLFIRKQLSLAALTLALIHGVISITMSSPFYLARAYDQPAVLETRLAGDDTDQPLQRVAVFNRLRQGRAELGLSVGAASICLLLVTGITRLPSVSAALSRRELGCVLSRLGWAALLAAVVHSALLGWDFMVRTYSCSTPSAQQVGIYLPTITVLLKLPLLIPLVSNHLVAIRAGYERVAS